MIINYFYEYQLPNGSTLNDTITLSFADLDDDKKPLEQPLIANDNEKATSTKRNVKINIVKH